MTVKRKRFEALEGQARQREDSAARAYLAGLSDRELDALQVELLRAAGQADPDGEAARARAEIEVMSDEDLWAALARLEGSSL